MLLLLVTFVAGALTVLAPCVLPLLPVIVGGSVAAGSSRRAFIVTGSLAVSVVAFTLLLKATTALIAIPSSTWSTLSAILVGLVGLSFAIPALWERLPLASLAAKAQRNLGAGARTKGLFGDILTGAALGPVFSSCSPTYFLILAAVLPVSFAKGFLYLVSYAAGLSLVLLLISLLGQRFASRLGWLADPKGWLRRGLGILMILTAIAVGFGLDKKIQTTLLDAPGFSALGRLDERLVELGTGASRGEGAATGEGQMLLKVQGPYHEIVQPSGYVNTDDVPFTIGQYVGKKVILLDFMTYSCINCQRTFPHLASWSKNYEDAGLVVIGIHTPEFAFERVKENVASELGKLGITFPVVLDNDYATWHAYGNNFWPREYLIDIDGNIVYDHIGEGKYDITERAIRQALMSRYVQLGIQATLPAPVEDGVMAESASKTRATGETYLGSDRSKGVLPYSSACSPGRGCASLPLNGVTVDGSWKQEKELLRLTFPSGKFAVRFTGDVIRVVASAPAGSFISGTIDGQAIGQVPISAATLYEIAAGLGSGEHLFEGVVQGEGATLFTFTFSS